MGKIKNLANFVKTNFTSLAMVSGGAWLIGTAYYREGARNVINYLNKNDLKVIDGNGEIVNLMVKPLIHID